MSFARVALQNSRALYRNRVALSRAYATAPEMLRTEVKDGVAWIYLNRPKKLNALCDQLVRELDEVTRAFDNDDSVGCMVLTGNEKAFAAGADIAEMAPMSYTDTFQTGLFAPMKNLRDVTKPIIAAVSGFALGGGCELAMMCDIIIASESAKFGQPEIKIGTIPGIGGTQRLTKAVGKSKAMELVLTGDFVDAEWAERSGLVQYHFFDFAQYYGNVSRVVADDQLLSETGKLAQKIASMSRTTVRLAKDAVNQSFEMNLTGGLHYERKLFESTFATQDQKIGMKAFVEKASPNWVNK